MSKCVECISALLKRKAISIDIYFSNGKIVLSHFSTFDSVYKVANVCKLHVSRSNLSKTAK